VCFIVPRFDAKDPVLADWARRLRVDFLPFRNINAPESLAVLGRFGADLFVSMSFDQILKRPILDLPRRGFINCHAGALPYYRGRNVLNWALINDAREFGVTVHYVDEGIDTGDIIHQETAPISDSDTYATLLDRAVVLCADVLYEALASIVGGVVRRRPQAGIHPVGFYCGRRTDGDEWIDWSWPSRRIFNFVRARTSPGPCARSVAGGHELLVRQAALIPHGLEYIGTPGEIVGMKDNGIVVKTGDSTILLVDVVSAAEIRYRIGLRLGLDYGSIVRQLLQRIDSLEQSIRPASAASRVTP
jgi:methionyl-tRNA formyltransferase